MFSSAGSKSHFLFRTADVDDYFDQFFFSVSTSSK